MGSAASVIARQASTLTANHSALNVAALKTFVVVVVLLVASDDFHLEPAIVGMHKEGTKVQREEGLRKLVLSINGCDNGMHPFY